MHVAGSDAGLVRCFRLVWVGLLVVAGASSAFAQFGADMVSSVSGRLSPESKKFAAEISGALGSDVSPAAQGNVAVGLWMTGRLQVALELMGKAVAADPANTDNQNNYAAMLTMSGAASQAVPVLEQLAQKFPDNPTVLNNLGQAYYLAAGEEDKDGKAEKALGRALAVAPGHSQAAATQSQIAQSKGNPAQAVEDAKQAVQRSVTRDKLNRLRKLGYKLTLVDMTNSRPTDPDPLGLKNFIAPPFPTNAVEENRTHREWAAFQTDIQTRVQALMKQLNALQAPMIAAANAKAQAIAEQLRNGNLPAGDAGGDAPAGVQPFARKAQLMLDLLDKDGGAKLRVKKAKEALDAFIVKNQQLVDVEYRAEFNQLDRKQANQVGEGLANSSFCEKYVTLADKYLGKWSDGREALYKAYLRELRLKLSEELYWQQWLQPRQEFQMTVIKAQIEWLAALGTTGIRTDGYIGIQVDEGCLKEKQQPSGKKLANFNDVHCQYHSELNLGIGSIVTDCDKMVSTLGVGPVKLGLGQDMAQGTDFRDSFVNCTVEITAGKSVGANAGPVSVEVGAEAGIGVEIGRNGVEDVYVTGKIEANVMNAAGTGAEARMSLVSGSTSANVLR